MLTLVSPAVAPQRPQMIYLSGAPRPETLARQYDLGVLLTPEMGSRPNLGGAVWAADNGLFTPPGAPRRVFRWERFSGLFSRFDKYALDNCLFAAVPDVPYDPEGTLASWQRWYPTFAEGLAYEVGAVPLAFVAQDGAELMLDRLPWDEFQVLFLGGSTCQCMRCTGNHGDPQAVHDPTGGWKVDPARAGVVAAEAVARGKWVHMGRANTFKRLQLARRFGARSADGTMLKYGADIHLPRLRGWLRELNGSPTEPLVVVPSDTRERRSVPMLVPQHTLEAARRGYGCARTPGNWYPWRGERRCIHCAFPLHFDGTVAAARRPLALEPLERAA